MANSTMKRTTKTTPKAKVETTNVETVENVVEEVKENKVKKVVVEETQPKEYRPTDGVLCESITCGGLYMAGDKTGILYKWTDCGDQTEVEYQDLVAAVRSSNNYIIKPYFIVRDKDFVAQFPKLNDIYESLYSIRDLKDVLRMDLEEMKHTIEILPDGAKETIKSLTAKMIQNGTIDSIQKIKFLDEYFDTNFMTMTNLFND